MEAGIICHTFSARSAHTTPAAASRGVSTGATCIPSTVFMHCIISQTVARKHTYERLDTVDLLEPLGSRRIQG